MGHGLYKGAVFLPPPRTYELGQRFGRVTIEAIESGGDTVPFALCTAEEGARFQEYCILYSHGNAEDLGQLIPLITRLSSDIGVSVAAYDYQGYGASSRADSEEELCYRDARRVFEHLTSSCGFARERMVLLGRSLGSGPTTHLAHQLSHEHVPFAGMVLQSPITSAVRVVSRLLSTVTIDMFQNIHKINGVQRPVLILHGTLDEVVPYAHGRELAATIDSGTELNRLIEFVSIEGAGHNDIEANHWPLLVEKISDFLAFLQSQPEFTWMSKKRGSSISSIFSKS